MTATTDVKGGAIAGFLAERIAKSFQTAVTRGRKPRLICPVCTESLAYDLHMSLRSLGVNSVLVAAEGQYPDSSIRRDTNITNVDKMVSFRLEPVTYVLEPGLLPLVPQSLRGSGGTSLKLEIPERWPLESGEISIFDLLEHLASVTWGLSKEDLHSVQSVLRHIVLPSLSSRPDGPRLLVEELLSGDGWVTNIGNSAQGFCGQAGVLWHERMADEITRPPYKLTAVQTIAATLREMVVSLGELDRRLVEVYQQDSETEVAEKARDLRVLMDGLFRNQYVLSGFMSLSSGLRRLFAKRGSRALWVSFDSLANLLDISTDDPSATVEFDEIISSAVLLGNVSAQPIVISTADPAELVTIRVSFEADFEAIQFRLKVGRRILSQQTVSQSQVSAVFDTTVDELLSPGGGNAKKIVAEVLAGSNVVARKTVDLVLLQSSDAMLICTSSDGKIDSVFSGSPTVVRVDSPTRVQMIAGQSLETEFNWYLDGEIQEARADPTRPGVVELAQTLDQNSLQAAESILEVQQAGISPDDDAINFEISLITTESKVGFYTVDSLLESEVYRFRGKVSAGLEEALDLFLGNETDVSRKLGIPRLCVARTSFARYFEASRERDPHAYAPLITDLFSTDELSATSFRVSVESDLVKISKVFEKNPFALHKEVSGDFSELLGEYGAARTEVIKLAKSNTDATLEAQPTYCYAPLYCNRSHSQMEELLARYVTAYCRIVQFVIGSPNARYLERFLALNIDCVLSIPSGTVFKRFADIKLYGPWHPIVAVQRFLYQKALTAYANRICESDVSGFGIFAKLTPLLRDSQLSYALASLGQENEQFARVVCQPDSGWMLALPGTAADYIAELKAGAPLRLAEDARRFRHCSGFDLLSDLDDVSESVDDMVSKYLASAPASKRVGIRFGAGFDLEDIVAELRVSLQDSQGEPTELANLLTGGVDVYVDGLHSEEATGPALEMSDDNLPVRLFSIMESSDTRLPGVDISFLSPRDSAEFAPYHQQYRKHVLRGIGEAFLLSRRPRRTRQTAERWESVGPIYEEAESSIVDNSPDDLEHVTRTMCSLLQCPELIGNEAMELSGGSVPTVPTGKWEYLPGGQTDPAILSQYLRDNRDRSLWDFQFGLGIHGKESHYVISRHTNVLLAALRSAIGGDIESVEDILLDMSRIGSPLLREANGTINKAKGCAGLVAAKRLIPLNAIVDAGCYPILVPIDSFDGVIGYKSSAQTETDSRMADLLLLVFRLQDDSSSAFDVRATAIEAKYRTKIPSSLSPFFTQTSQSYDRIERLFLAGTEGAFLPCRIAIAELVEFGLRLSNTPPDVSDRILQGIIRGDYEWQSNRLSSLVAILTPQENQETGINKQFDGGWSAVVKTSDFPGPSIDQNHPTKLISERVLSLLCDQPARPQTAGQKGGVPEPPPPADSGVTPSADHDEKPDAPLLTDLTSPEDEGKGRSIAGVPAPESDGDGRGPDEALRQGYATVARLLKEWKVSLEPVDSAPLMRNTPSCYRYQYKLRSSKDLSKASRADFLTAIKYELALDENADIAVSISRGFLVFEISKNKEDRYPVHADELWSRLDATIDNIDGLAVAVGESVATGEPVIINFKKLPHLLIAGQTGAGKSVAIETIVEGLTRFYTPEMFELSIVDFKGVDFLRYQGSPHLQSAIAGDAQGALQLLSGLVNTTNDRMKLFAENVVKNISQYNSKFPDSRLAYKMVVIDEFAELVLDETTKKEIIRLVQSIAQKSRAAGTHLIVCTQYPRGDVVDRLITANLPGRLCLKVPDNTASGIVINQSGAEKLALDGDALYVDGTSGVVRLQVAMVRD